MEIKSKGRQHNLIRLSTGLSMVLQNLRDNKSNLLIGWKEPQQAAAVIEMLNKKERKKQFNLQPDFAGIGTDATPDMMQEVEYTGLFQKPISL